MEFPKRISPCDDVKRVVSSSSSLRKKSTDGAANELVGLHIEKMGPICKTRKNGAAAISHDQTLVEVQDDVYLVMDRCLIDNNDCMWLSSDCLSPSSFFEQHRLSAAPFHSSDDDWLVSWLSTLAIDFGKENTNGGITLPLKSPKNGCEIDSSISSLVNLDGEDSEWISDTESEFQFDFLSPSYKSSWGSEAKSSNSSPSVTTQVKDKVLYEAADLEDFSAVDEEPLFWPFDCEQDWSSEEAWKCFSMSPRKDMAKVDSSRVLKFHDQKMNPKSSYGSQRKPVFSSGSKVTKTLELKPSVISNKGVKKINAAPSRLRKSSKVSVEVVPMETENDHTIKPTKGKVAMDDLASNEELPIEFALGLCEFDGHEGIDVDYLNEDVLLLEKPSELSIKWL